MKPYQNENAELFKTFMEATFFYNFRNGSRDSKEENLKLNYTGLELNISPVCDLGCKYCYLDRYGKGLYQNKKIDPKIIVKNLEKLLRFSLKNKLYFETLEIFSGDPFYLPYIWEIFDMMLTYFSEMELKVRPRSVSVPTNVSFLRYKDGSKQKFLEYKKKFKKIDVRLGLSLSIDGPFLDKQNRPSKVDNSTYNAKFYQEVVGYASEYKAGCHPMIYSQNIDFWMDTFLWFGENIDSLYLLEVRNAEWSVEQCNDLATFIRFAINFIFYKLCDGEKKKFMDFMKTSRYFNLFSHPFVTIGRGFGCSLQSSFHLQLHDMVVSPCHRSSYDFMKTANLEFSDDGLEYQVVPNNVELFLAEQVSDYTRLNPCSSCAINLICAGPCVGSNYETTGEIFTVSPSVCRMEHAKARSILKGYKEIGVFDLMLETVADKTRKSQLLFLVNS